MKTWQAALVHMGIAALQVGVGMPFTRNQVANTGISFGMQFGLTALHGWVAAKNSKSDPGGNPLMEISPGKFVSLPPPNTIPAYLKREEDNGKSTPRF